MVFKLQYFFWIFEGNSLMNLAKFLALIRRRLAGSCTGCWKHLEFYPFSKHKQQDLCSSLLYWGGATKMFHTHHNNLHRQHMSRGILIVIFNAVLLKVRFRATCFGVTIDAY